MALGGRLTQKTLLPSELEDSAGHSDFISRRPAGGAPEARPAPHCAAHTKRKGPGEAAFSRIPAAAAAAPVSTDSSCCLLFASGNMVSPRPQRLEGRRLRVGRLCVREGIGERLRHPLPQCPGQDEGLVLRGGRRRDARARALGLTGLDVPRAPPGLPSPPPPRWCARADTRRGGGGRGACARPPLAEQLVSRAAPWPKQAGSRGRAPDGSTRHLNSAGGGDGKARARGLGARSSPRGCS